VSKFNTIPCPAYFAPCFGRAGRQAARLCRRRACRLGACFSKPSLQYLLCLDTEIYTGQSVGPLMQLGATIFAERHVL
jgi:hypothetical protein